MFYSLQGFNIFKYWISEKLNSLSHVNELTIEISLHILKSYYYYNDAILPSSLFLFSNYMYMVLEQLF